MAACQNTPTPTPPVEQQPTVDEEIPPFVLMDATQKAVIVCSEKATKAEYQAALSLQAAIRNLTDCELTLTNDFDAGDDNSQRLEILVGETNRAQSTAARERIDELQLYIGVIDGKLVVRGSAPRITAYAVRVLVDEYLNRDHYDEATECLAVPSDLSTTRSYYDAVRGNALKRYEGATNGTESRPTSDVQPTTVPTRTWKEGAYLTGETLQVDVTDSFTGGTQFIAKLYTEGLSRAPKSEEYLECTAYIAKNGCTPASLGELAARIFSTEEFSDLGLTPTQTTFAVYRAVLNRDPSGDELATHSSKSADALARLLAESREFSTLIPGIIRGPYFWSGNNTAVYTGTRTMTTDELQALLNAGGVVNLPQGTLVLCDKTVVIPKGVTLQTEGKPTHYTQMARIIRVGDEKHNLIELTDNSTLSHVYVEGGLADSRVTGDFGKGGNVRIDGNGASVIGCRLSDPCGTFGVFVMSGTEFNYLGYNLITCYASDHSATWLDGIKCMGTDCLIEYNSVIDATDAGIAVFRFIIGIDARRVSDATYIRAQNSIVRYNNVFQAGNSCYVSLDFESNNINWSDEYIAGTTFNIVENPANFTGFAYYENQVWTSDRAHSHMLVACSTQPWAVTGMTDRLFGGSVYNNYTPAGCHANCAAGIVADMNTDLDVRGNSFALRLGNWCAGMGALRARIYSVDESDSSGNFQPGYENLKISESRRPFIGSDYPLEKVQTYTLKEGILHEGAQVISKERFDSK